jgi:hypothetical protein
MATVRGWLLLTGLLSLLGVVGCGSGPTGRQAEPGEKDSVAVAEAKRKAELDRRNEAMETAKAAAGTFATNFLRALGARQAQPEALAPEFLLGMAPPMSRFVLQSLAQHFDLRLAKFMAQMHTEEIVAVVVAVYPLFAVLDQTLRAARKRIDPVRVNLEGHRGRLLLVLDHQAGQEIKWGVLHPLVKKWKNRAGRSAARAIRTCLHSAPSSSWAVCLSYILAPRVTQIKPVKRPEVHGAKATYGSAPR